MTSRAVTPRMQPCVAELLRSDFHPPSLLLRVECISVEFIDRNVKQSLLLDSNKIVVEQRQAYRLLLGDGEYVIQAVLEGYLHYLFVKDKICVGAILDLKKFVRRKVKRKDGNGEVIYLAIENYEVATGAEPATTYPFTQPVEESNEDGVSCGRPCELAESSKRAAEV